MQGLVLKKRRGDLCLRAVMHERSSKQDFRLMMSFITGEVESRNEFAEWMWQGLRNGIIMRNEIYAE